MGISATVTGVGGWTVGPVLGRRPAGTARDAVHPGTGARGVLVVVDGRFTGRGLPDPETVARAAIVGSPAVMPMLDAGLLEDGTRWYVTPAVPGPVLDPAAGCSPRRAATIVEAVARALAAVHAAGLVHGLVGANAVIPAAGRHADRPVGTTLLLDTGVAALLGDRADDLAAAAGVSMPADRGPAADVYALGALLLRLVTAAAPAGPALAALPVPLRALLSAMLDEHPSRRPTADAVARSLAGMREELLGTGPVDLPRSAPVAVQPAPAPAPRSAPVQVVAPARVAAPARVTAPVPAPAPVRSAARVAPPIDVPPSPPVARDLLPRPVVPAPIRAPHTAESSITAPRIVPAPAPSLWTGPVRIAPPARPGRTRAKRVLLLAGGVGLAGLVFGVVTHLPLDHVQGDQAVAAVAADGGLSVADAPIATTAAATPAASTTKAPKHRATPVAPSASGSVPAFVRPTAAVPSPLVSSATSTTPSRNTTTPVTTGSTASSTGSSAPSSAPASSGPSTSASSATPNADAVASTSSTPTEAESSSAPSSSVPAESSTPTGSGTPSDEPTASASATPDPSASASDPTPSDSASADSSAPSDSPDPS